MKKPDKVLVVVTLRIGDVLLATPLLSSMRQAWPQGRIDVLVFAGTEGVLSANPDIDQIITVTHRQPLGAHLRFMCKLWRQYDLAVTTMPSDRPTLYAWAAGRRCVGLAASGSKHAWKRGLLSRWSLFDDIDTHTVLMNLKIADLLGLPRCHEVVVAWSKEDEKQMRDVLPFDPDTNAYAALHVHPMFAYKAWRREAWAELAHWLSRQGVRVVLTGSNRADELDYIRDLMELLPGDVVNVAGKLGLSGVACLLSRARVYVGPDTVVTHLAAAVGSPTVALFGPSNPVKWGPWPHGYTSDVNPFRLKGTQRVNNVLLVQGEGSCVPCFQEGCERHTASLSACLQELPASRVIAAVQELWLAYPAAVPRPGLHPVTNGK